MENMLDFVFGKAIQYLPLASLCPGDASASVCKKGGTQALPKCFCCLLLLESLPFKCHEIRNYCLSVQGYCVFSFKRKKKMYLFSFQMFNQDMYSFLRTFAQPPNKSIFASCQPWSQSGEVLTTENPNLVTGLTFSFIDKKCYLINLTTFGFSPQHHQTILVLAKLLMETLMDYNWDLGFIST